MAEIKISEMDELIPYDHYTLEGGTDGADYIPLLDSSESSPNLQNKKVSIQTLFDDYTRLYNSPIYAIGSNSISKIILINNLYIIDNNSSNYILLDPNNNNRSVEISLLTQGQTRLIKNVGSNLITLTNLQFAIGTISLQYELPAYETVQIFFDGTDHHVIYLDQTITYPDSKLTVNNSAPSVTSAEVGLLGLNNDIPQYVNSVGSWTNLASSNSTVYQQIKLRRITSTQSISANTFPATLFNQVSTTNTGTSIGSFNTTTGILTLDAVGTYMFVGTLTLNGGAVGTRTIFYAESPLTGQVDTSTRVESIVICNSAGSFVLPINLVIKVTAAPVTFQLTTASSTNVSIANANFTLSSFAESQVTIVKIN